MHETEAAYLAGLIDGEGCIHATTTNRAPHRKTRGLQLLLEVWNTNEEIIDYLHGQFGGYRGTQDRFAQQKPLHVWRVSIGGVREILPQLMPYLRIKRRQAEVAMDLANLPVGKPFQPVSAELQAQREDLVAQIKAFNKRGREVPT
jgi:hypothetical protein